MTNTLPAAHCVRGHCPRMAHWNASRYHGLCDVCWDIAHRGVCSTCSDEEMDVDLFIYGPNDADVECAKCFAKRLLKLSQGSSSHAAGLRARMALLRVFHNIPFSTPSPHIVAGLLWLATLVFPGAEPDHWSSWVFVYAITHLVVILYLTATELKWNHMAVWRVLCECDELHPLYLASFLSGIFKGGLLAITYRTTGVWGILHYFTAFAARETDYAYLGDTYRQSEARLASGTGLRVSQIDPLISPLSTMRYFKEYAGYTWCAQTPATILGHE